MSRFNNDVTGDRITNVLKGDKEKYSEGWDRIFGKSEKDKQRQRGLIRSIYTTYRDEENLEHISDNLLYNICEQWVVQGSDLNFEDWVEYYLEIDDD